MKPRLESRPHLRRQPKPGLTNAQIAELLALEAEKQGHFLAKALRRASRAAFTWPEEAADLLQEGRSLAGLPAIGPFLARMIHEWIEQAVQVPEPPTFVAISLP